MLALGASGAMVFYSPVTAAGIWRGARASEEQAIAALFSAMTAVPIDAEIGRRAGEYLRRFFFSHHVEVADALIAATAAIHQLPSGRATSSTIR